MVQRQHRPRHMCYTHSTHSIGVYKKHTSSLAVSLKTLSHQTNGITDSMLSVCSPPIY
mgnify:CR=1 FL=1